MHRFKKVLNRLVVSVAEEYSVLPVYATISLDNLEANPLAVNKICCNNDLQFKGDTVSKPGDHVYSDT